MALIFLGVLIDFTVSSLEFHQVKLSWHAWWVAPNSRDLSLLDYQVWAMLEFYHKLQRKPKSIAEFKDALQSIWSAYQW